MVDTQIACLTEEVLPALKKKGLNLVDYDELHLHEKDQVPSLNVLLLGVTLTVDSTFCNDVIAFCNLENLSFLNTLLCLFSSDFISSHPWSPS